ncbi:hypothetical protein TSTA_095950 [Talaromyces stipitatus ATCC 10500]|uniref:FHA domain-containing protein n=1 Tax=Talaromyces stipitatus (strain ATCC 10500 / CBS 375.48 / QM 6759 / NRRL 1006) TaxID=441959 RepID=B8M3H4_TALSN|nr:uncharacterized protein TSTA_095950 [Talaromyces stipitatus ATCC 10500]EED22346.1 hypothetical protein TSTA_095950 [Talaromyces stipitatus ATCC 10500]
MLNKIHSPLPEPSTDLNAYELGELNGYYVVITCLPYSIYGMVAAANVVSRMRATYPRLQYGLMVGIGGGVLGKNHDIRLGDVVVSKLAGEHSGVIEYDYGKAIGGGKLDLLSHMNQLEAKRMMGNFLFEFFYNHAGGEGTCEKCDKDRLVKRKPRETRTPFVHYGLIASEDQHNSMVYSLCFEMEAAGLMDDLLTLVIRGICDYCDSHKQKQWQGYAALTATAYAKSLLSIIPISRPDVELMKSKNMRHWMVSLPRNLKFVGRLDEITKLEGLITLQDGTRRIAITGLGGVRKTQVDDHIEDSTLNSLFKSGLQSTFNPGPRAGPGYILGTDKNSCDIVLLKLARISRRHCFFTFDEKRRLILQDCSQNGTIVTYNGKGGEKRRDFKWILSGDRVPEDTENILLEFHNHLKFRIIVPKHETCPDLYAGHVDRFLQEGGRLVQGTYIAQTDVCKFGEHIGVDLRGVVRQAETWKSTTSASDISDISHQGDCLSKESEAWNSTTSASDISDISHQGGRLSQEIGDDISSSCNGITSVPFLVILERLHKWTKLEANITKVRITNSLCSCPQGLCSASSTSSASHELNWVHGNKPPQKQADSYSCSRGTSSASSTEELYAGNSELSGTRDGTKFRSFQTR